MPIISSRSDAHYARTLELALRLVALAMNRSTAQDSSIEAHAESCFLKLIRIAQGCPAILEAISILDTEQGHPENPLDFDSADMSQVDALWDRTRKEIDDHGEWLAARLGGPQTGSLAG